MTGGILITCVVLVVLFGGANVFAMISLAQTPDKVGREIISSSVVVLSAFTVIALAGITICLKFPHIFG